MYGRDRPDRVERGAISNFGRLSDWPMPGGAPAVPGSAQPGPLTVLAAAPGPTFGPSRGGLDVSLGEPVIRGSSQSALTLAYPAGLPYPARLAHARGVPRFPR